MESLSTQAIVAVHVAHMDADNKKKENKKKGMIGGYGVQLGAN